MKCLKLILKRTRAAGRGLASDIAERGQATLEYLLLIIIVVILILSLLYQFHDSFRIYAEAFFDGYVRCLLETGELPGTGSSCSADYTAFDPKAGKNLLKDNLPTSSAGSGGAAAAQAQAAAAAAKAKASHSETASGRGGRTSTVGSFGNSGRPASVAVGTVEGSASSTIKGDDALIGVSNTIPQNRARYGDADQKPVVDNSGDDGATTTEDAKAKTSVVTKKKVVDGNSLRPTKAVEQLDRKPAGLNLNPGGEFSVSDLVRLFIIILIIIAMVIFFGGQLMQISKSREKGGD